MNELLFRIEAVKAAEDKKYVLMNAPTERLMYYMEVSSVLIKKRFQKKSMCFVKRL